MDNDFSFEEMMPTLLETLNSGGEVTFTVTGNSMLPMLRSRVDSVTLSAASDRLKKYDLPFYRRSDGKYILHRIIKVNKNDYTARGDNCTYTEYGITDEDIIGVVTRFVRKGKSHTVNGFFYRAYCHLCCSSFGFVLRKKVLLGTRIFLARIYRRIIKKK